MALVLLVALFIGALLPVLYELRATLRAARRSMNTTVPEIREQLADAGEVLDGIKSLVEGLGSTTKVLGAIGAAVGPAIVAGLSSYREARDEAAQRSQEPFEEEADDERVETK